MKPVVEVSSVSKTFFNDPLWQRVSRWMFGRARADTGHRVLREISFSIHSGESVGIVGVNGAGKSTLLKLLVGTLAPSSGTIAVHGHLSAILELGMGLNEQLTARDNARLSLAMYGVAADQIEVLIPWIAEFSELGAYFDEPVRVLSSGMTMRLAFSIATSIRPEILIVDEALSVGDAYFQHKCADHIRELKRAGTTLLFVSHDTAALQALCDRAILLDQGQLAADGETAEVLSLYNALLSADAASNAASRAVINSASGVIESGTRAAEITDYALVPIDSTRARPEDGSGFWIGEAVALIVSLQIQRDLEHCVVGFLLTDRNGQQVFGTNTHYLSEPSGQLVRGTQCQCRFEMPLNFGLGSYALTLALTPDQTHLTENFHWIDRALVFELYRPTALPYSIGVSHVPVAATLTVDDA